MKFKKYKIWFYSTQSLIEIGEKFLDEKIITDCNYDYENVFEWFTAKSDDSEINYNVSRKHAFWDEYEEEELGEEHSEKDNTKVQALNSKEPITFMVEYKKSEPSDEAVEQLATMIHKTLNVPVFIGEVNYISNNDFEYIPSKEIV